MAKVFLDDEWYDSLCKRVEVEAEKSMGGYFVV